MISMLLVRVAGFEPAAASEEARSVLFPRFAEEPRKLHIRRLLLPFQIKTASLGFDLATRGRQFNTIPEKIKRAIPKGMTRLMVRVTGFEPAAVAAMDAVSAAERP